MNDDPVIEPLLREAHAVGERIAGVVLAGERIAAFGATGIAAAATLVIADHKPYILMIFPFGLATLITYILFFNNEAMSLGGYKAAIEEQIELRAKFPLVQWESKVVDANSNLVQVLSVFTLLGLGYALVSVMAMAQAIETLSSHRWGHELDVLYVIATPLSILIGFGTVGACVIAQDRELELECEPW